MRFRYQDRPVRFYKEKLLELDTEGGYLAQLKLDGWNCNLCRDTTKKIAEKSWGQGSDGSIFCLSRRDVNKGGPTRIPCSDTIIKSIEALNLPDQTMLASEWVARRTIGELPEQLFLFDAMWLKDEWLGEMDFVKRYGTLCELIPGEITTDRLKNGGKYGYAEIGQDLNLSTNFENSFIQVYEKISTDPTLIWAEGLVLKHKESKIKGDFQKGVDNGLQIKVRWRSGASGRDVVR